MTTRVSKATATLVIVDQLHTVEAAGGVAGRRQAFVEIPFTVFSDKPWRAGARVAAHTVHTLSSVQTARLPGALLGGTVIHVHLTLDPMCSRWARTGEAIDQVDAGSPMHAGLRVTFVDVILTVDPLIARFTDALVCALIVFACGTVAARVRLAFVDHLLTVAACVSWLALALVGITHIHTAPGILAHTFNFHTIPGSVVLAGHVGDVTVDACPSHCAVAGPGGRRCLRAGAAVVTAYLGAQVHIVLAVLSVVSHGAGAAVGAEAVGAGASVLAGLRVTLVLLVLAERAVKTRTATAGEGVDVINAGPVI